MSVALLFPGQGSQTAGMLRGLPDHPVVESTLRQAEEVLEEKMNDLDGEERLRSTQAAQLALLVCGVASAGALISEAQEEAEIPYVAGHSVGAFAAAVVSGALDFEDALRLVRLRGRLMERAFPEGYGMAALEGIGERSAEQLARRVRESGGELYLANINSPSQVVVAGEEEALGMGISLAREAGARRAERIAVAVPSHCPLLSGVSRNLSEALRPVEMREPERAYVTDATARAVGEAEAIREDLARSVASPVRWSDAVSLLSELGCALFIEARPARVLTRLALQTPGTPRAVALAELDLRSAVVLAGRASSSSL